MKLALENIMRTAAVATIIAVTAVFIPAVASADSDQAKNSHARVAVVLSGEGNALVRGAKVTSVSGTTINASVTLGASTLTWAIQTDSATKFYNLRGGAIDINAVVVGDTISFAGAMSGSGNPFTVLAKTIRNEKNVPTEATLSGTVASIDTGASKLVLDKKRGKGSAKTVTVQLSNTTTITLNNASSSLSSLQTGDGLKVAGTLSADGTTLTATSVAATRPAEEDEKKHSARFWRGWFNGKAFLKL